MSPLSGAAAEPSISQTSSVNDTNIAAKKPNGGRARTPTAPARTANATLLNPQARITLSASRSMRTPIKLRINPLAVFQKSRRLSCVAASGRRGGVGLPLLAVIRTGRAVSVDLDAATDGLTLAGDPHELDPARIGVEDMELETGQSLQDLAT